MSRYRDPQKLLIFGGYLIWAQASENLNVYTGLILINVKVTYQREVEKEIILMDSLFLSDYVSGLKDKAYYI